MGLQALSDDGVAALYENIRQQVEADRHSKYRFAAGQHARQRAEELRDELIRRRMHFSPISW
jgi:nickel-dependent lactate racemase